MFVGSWICSFQIFPVIALLLSTYKFLNILLPLSIRIYVIITSPAVTIDAFTKLCQMKAFSALDMTIQYKPVMKQPRVISILSSSTCTACSADSIPSLPLRNLPGPNTEQVAAFKIAHNSRPIALAVIDRQSIQTSDEVELGNSIFKLENPKPASIAAIPEIPL